MIHNTHHVSVSENTTIKNFYTFFTATKTQRRRLYVYNIVPQKR